MCWFVFSLCSGLYKGGRGRDIIMHLVMSSPQTQYYLLINKKTSNTLNKKLLKSALKMHQRRSKIQKFSYPGEGNTPSPADFVFFYKKTWLCIYYQKNNNILLKSALKMYP